VEPPLDRLRLARLPHRRCIRSHSSTSAVIRPHTVNQSPAKRLLGLPAAVAFGSECNLRLVPGGLRQRDSLLPRHFAVAEFGLEIADRSLCLGKRPFSLVASLQCRRERIFQDFEAVHWRRARRRHARRFTLAAPLHEDDRNFAVSNETPSRPTRVVGRMGGQSGVLLACKPERPAHLSFGALQV